MGRKLIIDGNAVYELDEDCMLKKKIEEEKNRQEMFSNANEQKNEGRRY